MTVFQTVRAEEPTDRCHQCGLNREGGAVLRWNNDYMGGFRRGAWRCIECPTDRCWYADGGGGNGYWACGRPAVGDWDLCESNGRRACAEWNTGPDDEPEHDIRPLCTKHAGLMKMLAGKRTKREEQDKLRNAAWKRESARQRAVRRARALLEPILREAGLQDTIRWGYGATVERQITVDVLWLLERIGAEIDDEARRVLTDRTVADWDTDRDAGSEAQGAGSVEQDAESTAQ